VKTQKPLLLTVSAILAVLGAYYYIAAERQTDTTTGNPLANVVVPELDGAAREGEALFNASCASCHGANAAGKEGAAPPLVHKIYEPNHHGDMAFYRAVENGVRQHHWPFGNMSPVLNVSRDDVTTIIAYVRTLQRANGIE